MNNKDKDSNVLNFPNEKASNKKRKSPKMRDTSEQQALYQAQQLIYDAWECHDQEERINMAMQALEISPLCADAFLLMAQEVAVTPGQALDCYRSGMEAGKEAIGEKNFEKYKGAFWGFHDTRPYMRAREGYADTLLDFGEYHAALSHYYDMLELNPDDNQGIRYKILECLFELNCNQEAQALLEQFKHDQTTVFLYSAALLGFRKHGQTKETDAQLKKALAANKYAPQYISGKTKLPKQEPNVITAGTKNEAAHYATYYANFWQETAGAIEWLTNT